MTRLPPLRPRHWRLPRHERRWYSPLCPVRRRGPWRPKPFLTVFGCGEVRVCGCVDGAQVDAVHGLHAADVRSTRRDLRAYLRRIGVPGRTIREACGGLHRGGRCWVTPCPSAAWRAAMALRGAP